MFMEILVNVLKKIRLTKNKKREEAEKKRVANAIAAKMAARKRAQDAKNYAAQVEAKKRQDAQKRARAAAQGRTYVP